MSEAVEQTFTVPAPARLTVSNIRGHVTVERGDEGVITIKALKHSNSGDAERTEIELSQAQDGSVKAETRYREGFWLFMFGSKPCKVDYTIQAPAECALHINVVSSEASIEGIQGDLELHTVSGDITLKAISGQLKLDAVSGKIDGQDIKGDLKANTVSGGIRMFASELASADISTVSGDLTFQTPLGNGPYHYNSVSGNVRLIVPPETGFSAHVSSISGGLHTSLPLLTNHRHGGKQTVQTKNPGPGIHLSSVSGDLWISTPDGQPVEQAEVEAAAPPPPPPAPLSRKEVLERIERGEITVDEGLELLQ